MPAPLSRIVISTRAQLIDHLIAAERAADQDELMKRGRQFKVQGGLALDPSFTISHFRAIAASANPTCLAQRKRLRNGMRKARMLE
jgi:hypothetical protein